MKLLVLDQYSEPGGAQQCLLDLLPAMVERGWKVTVGLPGKGELFERVGEFGIATERIACGPYSSGTKSAADVARFVAEIPRLARQIEDLANGLEAGLVYINGPRLIPAAARAELRAPVLFHSHSYLPPGPVRWMTGMCLRGMRARVVGACRFVADPWKDYVGSEHVSVIYNGVAGPPVEQDLGASPGGAGRAIGCIGRIAPEKGQREFLRAASVIHQAVPDCRFLVYGAALFADPGAARYEAEVRAAAAGLPVEFPGWVADVYAAMAKLDLVLVPSAGHEATTRVILEAFAAGVPVIACHAGGIPEVVEHDVDGLLADSTEEMARLAIGLLSGAPDRMTAMSQAARATWRRRFTLENYRERMVKLMTPAAQV